MVSAKFLAVLVLTLATVFLLAEAEPFMGGMGGMGMGMGGMAGMGARSMVMRNRMMGMGMNRMMRRQMMMGGGMGKK